MSLPQSAATAGVPTAPGRPAQARVVANLVVDFGNHRDYENHPARARYLCDRCGYRSDIVTGPAAVAAFTATARDTHRSVCPALQENHQ
ncbi:hypothetical protein [Streptomyces fulvorobeus]|uniref:Uncharacterized protein n=1 Tax=Streptomyces fulvorobeus TaxID=284028 RepID=A0A7J0C3T4_9ACTN|nr:hypothetical protein [Streptomyces fulvorobeus]NYE40725.1 hypothetical protein [Streptomyces fulvorobeus]GFM97028.1 hypothetical protein Sfulv_18390 [Streptomyces fulvorobeus]